MHQYHSNAYTSVAKKTILPKCTDKKQTLTWMWFVSVKGEYGKFLHTVRRNRNRKIKEV